MDKQGILTLLFGVTLGVCVMQTVWLCTALGPNSASGQTVDSKNNWVMGSGQLAGKGNADALYLWNTEDKKLLVYFVNGETLKLLSVRDCSYDAQVFQLGTQQPSVEEIKKQLKKDKDN